MESNNTKITEMNKENTKNIKKQTPEFFHPNNKGLFGVWVKKLKPDDTEMSPHSVGRHVFGKYDIREVLRRGDFQAEILFNKRDEANQFLKDAVRNAKCNLIAFTPDHRIKRQGVIKGISTELSVEDIMLGISSEKEVLDIEKLKMRKKFSKTKEDQ